MELRNPLECRRCDGCGEELDFMGATGEPCYACNGARVRRCEEEGCGDYADRMTDAGALCGPHADHHEHLQEAA